MDTSKVKFRGSVLVGLVCGCLPPGRVSAYVPPNACRGERRGGWGRAAPIRSVRLHGGILARRPVAKRTVRPLLIVFDAPLFEDHPRFEQAAKQLTVQALVPQFVVEALNVGVLPRAARRDVDRPHLLRPQPVPDRIRDELRPVVAADVPGPAVARHRRFDHRDHVHRSDRPRRMRGEAHPAVFIDQREHPEPRSILRLVLHEVPAPHRVHRLRALPR